MTHNLDLDALQAAEAKATQRSSRKWIASYRKDGTGSVYSPSLGPCREVVPIAETMAEDATFIATMRNALPSLIDEIRRLRAVMVAASRWESVMAIGTNTPSETTDLIEAIRAEQEIR